MRGDSCVCCVFVSFIVFFLLCVVSGCEIDSAYLCILCLFVVFLIIFRINVMLFLFFSPERGILF